MNGPVFADLHDLFRDEELEYIAETELEYVFRKGERHWNRFLSHHVMYQRT